MAMWTSSTSRTRWECTGLGPPGPAGNDRSWALWTDWESTGLGPPGPAGNPLVLGLLDPLGIHWSWASWTGWEWPVFGLLD